MTAKKSKAETANRPTRRSRGNRLKTLITDKTFYVPVLFAILTVVLFVLGIIFIPKLLSTPLDQPYADPSVICKSDLALLDEVRNFNFNFGGDSKLALKIEKAVGGTGEPGCYYYSNLAAAEYQYGLHNYDRAIAFAEDASDYSDGEAGWEEIVKFYIKTYTKQGNTDKRDYWQGVYDEYQAEPEDCADEELATEEVSE